MSYYHNLIPDFGLTPGVLELKYSPDGEGQHPELSLSRAAWRFAVAQQETLHGYWVWLRSRLQEAEDELDRDNPYAQYGAEG